MKDNNRVISFLGWILADLSGKDRHSPIKVTKSGNDVYISKSGMSGHELMEYLKGCMIARFVKYGVDIYDEDLSRISDDLDKILAIEESRLYLNIKNYKFKW